MLSQFSKEQGGKTTLADLDYHFPEDVYPVGRLDAESEGLLLLTNDRSVNNRLLDPIRGHRRSYLVQVDGAMSDIACKQLMQGMEIRVKSTLHQTLPAVAALITEPSWIPERNPPIRVRKNIPTSWLRLTLTEGKNHQVRKMTAGVGHPTLRLIRESIGKLGVEGLAPGTVREMKRPDLFPLIGL